MINKYDIQLYCQRDGHNFQQINGVCGDKNCKESIRLCCLSCLKENHSSHRKKVIGFKEYKNLMIKVIEFKEEISILCGELTMTVEMICQMMQQNQINSNLNIGFITTFESNEQVKQVMNWQIIQNKLQEEVAKCARQNQNLKLKCSELKPKRDQEQSNQGFRGSMLHSPMPLLSYRESCYKSPMQQPENTEKLQLIQPIELRCTKWKHESMIIDGICMRKACFNSRPVCFWCIQNGFHEQHQQQIWDQNRYAKAIESSVKKIISLNTKSKSLDHFQFFIQNFLRESKQSLSQNIANLTLTALHDQADQLIIFEEVYEDLNVIFTKFESVLKVFEINNLFENLNQDLPYGGIRCQSMKVRIPKDQFQFSQVQKNAKIIIRNQDSVATGEGFCICQPKIPQYKVTTFSFKLKYCASQIYIGICSADLIEKAQYQPELSEIGHGCYLINTDGFSYSHHDEAENNIFKTEETSNHDLISVEVDMKNEKVSWFYRESGIQQFILSMKISIIGKLFPCVQLPLGGEIEIIKEN